MAESLSGWGHLSHASKVWAVEDPDSAKAYCKNCKKTLKPRKRILENQEKGKHHKEVCESLNKSDTLKNRRQASKAKDEVSIAEIKLAAAIGCHCSFLTTDHQSEIISEHGKGSVWASIPLHRPKCTKIVTNVIAPFIVLKQKRDYKAVLGYSIIVDKSTDISSDKHLAIQMYKSTSAK